MKQVFKTNRGQVVVENVPVPVPGPRELLVRIDHSLISTGTETSAMRRLQELSLLERIAEKKELFDKVRERLATAGIRPTAEAIWRRLNPSERNTVLVPIGYSNAGTVIAVGDGVSGFNVGDRVACAGGGVAVHAQYTVVPINLAVCLMDEVDSVEGAFATVGAIALQGLRRGNLQFGETVVVTGLGLLGLLAVQIAKAWGLVVIGLDIDDERLALATELGADLCLRADAEDTERQVEIATKGHGADSVVIYAATDSSGPANQALRLCRQRGTVVVVGAVGMDLDRGPMYRKELDFVMSTSYGPGRYDRAYEEEGRDYPYGYVRWTENRNMAEFVRLVAHKKIQVAPLVDRQFPVDCAVDAYGFLSEAGTRPVSAIISYSVEPEGEVSPPLSATPRSSVSGRIRTAVIGAGGFASATHLPNILELSDRFELAVVASRSTATVMTAKKRFQPQQVTLDYREVLADPGVDLVVISTRHDHHGHMAAEALAAGKHVLVEKPLAMNREELAAVVLAERAGTTHLTVGFNRRYSPLAVELRSRLIGRQGPSFATYRVNAGYIPPDNWNHDPIQGGGRIIGECCHFLDLLEFLIGSPLVGFEVSSLPVDGGSVRTHDNLGLLLRYGDGSLAQLSYVCVGGKGLAKEHLEVHKDRASFVLDDFVSLTSHGTSDKPVVSPRQDKGHRQELEEFGKLIAGEANTVMALESALRTTTTTFEIGERIRNVIYGQS